MKAVFGERKSKLFTLGLTRSGRLWAAAERLFFMFLTLSVVGTIFFLPDYMGRYRAEEPVSGLLFGLLLLAALAASLLAATLRYFRREFWVLDVEEGALVYQSGKLFGRGAQQYGIDFEHIERFLVEINPSPRESRMLAQFHDGKGERILVTRVGGASLAEVAEALTPFLRKNRIQIPIVIAPLD